MPTQIARELGRASSFPVLKARINSGVAWIRESGFTTADHKARLDGKADLRSGNLALWGRLSVRTPINRWKTSISSLSAEPFQAHSSCPKSSPATDLSFQSSELVKGRIDEMGSKAALFIRNRS